MIKVFKTPFFYRWIFHRRVWGFLDKKAVYLTFDDGPTEELTQWILNFLKEQNIKATFFCVGSNAKKLPVLINQIKSEGHALGNHTMRHEKGIKVSKKDYLQSIKETSEHIDSNLFRPPYGRMPVSFSKAIQKDYKIIMWSWLSYDYDKTVTIDKILRKAKQQIRGGDILVLHDNLKVEDRLKMLLPELVNIIHEKGLEFKAL